MKKTLTSFLLITLTTTFSPTLKAQNLVPNPSFEDTLECPVSYSDLESYCKYWKSFRYSPDYFNSCSAIDGFHNPFGYQQARTGQAYAGLAMYQWGIPTGKEQLGVQLISPLSIGTKYYLTFYISLAYNYDQENIAVNKIGAHFTTYQYHDSTGQMPFYNYAHVYSDSVIKDSINWVQISGSFIADSSYQYLSIGAFFDSPHTDTLNLPFDTLIVNHNQVSYYYIDDVCLSTDSAICNLIGEGIIQLNNNSSIQIFPNPAHNQIEIIGNEIQSITLYDVLGRVIYLSEQEISSPLTINTTSFSRGIYFLQARMKEGVVVRKVVLQ